MNSLTIRISQNHIVFTTYDRLQNLLPDYDVYNNDPDISLNANIHKAIKMIGLAPGDYNFVDVYVGDTTTLVPLKEFEEDDIDDIYFFNYPSLRQRDKVFYDTLPYLNSLLLFSVDKDVCHSLKEFFPGVKFHNPFTALILQYASRYPYTSTKPRMYCYLCEGNMTIIVIKAGQLVFMNTYKLYNPSDALYYIQIVANRLEVDPSAEMVYIGGDEEVARTLTSDLANINMQGFHMKDSEELSRHPISKIKDFPYDLKVVLLKAY